MGNVPCFGFTYHSGEGKISPFVCEKRWKHRREKYKFEKYENIKEGIQKYFEKFESEGTYKFCQNLLILVGKVVEGM